MTSDSCLPESSCWPGLLALPPPLPLERRGGREGGKRCGIVVRGNRDGEREES